jgi:hypothetical protein
MATYDGIDGLRPRPTVNKLPVRVASTANIADFNNVATAIDGITLVVGDRVLVKDQSTTGQNGIYFCQSLGPVVLTRTRDWIDGEKDYALAGANVYVQQGSLYAEKTFTMTTAGGAGFPTIGSTGLLWFALEAIGDVVGPGSSIDNAIPRFDLTTGKILQGGLASNNILIDDTGNIVPEVSNGGGLGTSSLMFSDLFLAEGSVLNFNNGNVTLTHLDGQVTLGGGSLMANDDIEFAFGTDYDAWMSWALAATTGFSSDVLRFQTSSSGILHFGINNIGADLGGFARVSGEAIAVGDVLAVDSADGKLYLADADHATVSRRRPLGISLTSAAGVDITMVVGGIGGTAPVVNTNLSGASRGDPVYVDATTPGGLTTTAPVTGDVWQVGIVVNAAVAGSARIQIRIQAGTGAVGGDVAGPGSSIDNAIPRFDLTTGKILQGGLASNNILIDDTGNIVPEVSNGGGLGTTSFRFSDLFLATGGVINFAGGETITHATNTLTFAGASTGYLFGGGPVRPTTNDGAALGTSSFRWADMFLSTGGVIQFGGTATTITGSNAANLTLEAAVNIDLKSAGTTIGSWLSDGGLRIPAATGSLSAASSSGVHHTVKMDGGPTVPAYLDDSGCVEPLVSNWRFMVAHSDQLSLNGSSGQVSQAIIVYLATNASDTNTLFLTDGTTTRSYEFESGGGITGDVSVTVGGNQLASMTNLAAAINGDGSGLWNALHITGTTLINGQGIVLIQRRVQGASQNDRTYGTGFTAMRYISFAGEADYRRVGLGILFPLIPVTDPAAKEFGQGRVSGDLLTGDTFVGALDQTQAILDEISNPDEWVLSGTIGGSTGGTADAVLLAFGSAGSTVKTSSLTIANIRDYNPVKRPCRLATTADVTLTAANAPSAVDSVTTVVGNRILVRSQSTASENGIYEVTVQGAGDTSTWVRTTDFNNATVDYIEAGVETYIQEGTTLNKTRYTLVTTGTITIGSTSLTFE